MYISKTLTSVWPLATCAFNYSENFIKHEFKCIYNIVHFIQHYITTLLESGTEPCVMKPLRRSLSQITMTFLIPSFIVTSCCKGIGPMSQADKLFGQFYPLMNWITDLYKIQDLVHIVLFCLQNCKRQISHSFI